MLYYDRNIMLKYMLLVKVSRDDSLIHITSRAHADPGKRPYASKLVGTSQVTLDEATRR